MPDGAVLADTSVWARHLRLGDPELARLLRAERVVIHPLVLLELASRSLRRREELLALLGTLPAAAQAEHDEVLSLLGRRGLAGRGLAAVDLHLLASALLTPAALWTSDRRLQEVAQELGVAYRAAAPPREPLQRA